MHKYLFPDKSEIDGFGYGYRVFEITRGEIIEEKMILSENDIRNTFDAHYRCVFMNFHGFSTDLNYKKILKIIDKSIMNERIIFLYKQIETKINMFLSYIRANYNLDKEEFMSNNLMHLMKYQYLCTGLVSYLITINFGPDKKDDTELRDLFLKILFVVLSLKISVSYDDEYVIYEKCDGNDAKRRILPDVLMYDTLKDITTPEGKIDTSYLDFINKYLFN